MNFELLALNGWQLPVLIVLSVVAAGLVAVDFLLVRLLMRKPAAKSLAKATEEPTEETPEGTTEQPAEEPIEEPLAEEIVSAEEPIEEPLAEEAVPAEETIEEPLAEENVPAEETIEEPVAEELVPEDEPIEEPVAEELVPEDELVAEEAVPEEEPNEETYAAADIQTRIEESVAEEPISEEEPAEGPVEEAVSEEVPAELHGVSSAETVEEILEEHGLEVGDEISTEIAEEIMSVHTLHTEAEAEVLRVEGLYKRYSKKADYAVADVNFTCYEGEIVGLLGHNGAGKSTTLKCLEGMLPFEKGKISICGHDIKKDPLAAKFSMGFVTDNHATFVKMTGIQYLSFIADIYKVPSEVRKERVEKLESVFQLGDAINNLISSYSHGMRQKICMMGSLMHMPKLWVLDEPMTGLDPRTMHAVQVFMREYAHAGNCIIFSSHALITVAKMCDRVVLMKKGQQLDDLNIKRIMTVDPNFDFEEYFLRHEGQD